MLSYTAHLCAQLSNTTFDSHHLTAIDNTIALNCHAFHFAEYASRAKNIRNTPVVQVDTQQVSQRLMTCMSFKSSVVACNKKKGTPHGCMQQGARA